MAKLHLVFGGELKQLAGSEFKDPKNIDIVGIFTSYEEAQIAWKAAAQKTVDNALIRYYIADLTQLRKGD